MDNYNNLEVLEETLSLWVDVFKKSDEIKYSLSQSKLCTQDYMEYISNFIKTVHSRLEKIIFLSVSNYPGKEKVEMADLKLEEVMSEYLYDDKTISDILGNLIKDFKGVDVKRRIV